jgi:DnaK suppressor protein
MDKRKLEHWKEKLIQKKLSLTDMVERTESYGREKEPAIQDVADMAAASYTREFMFGKSSGDRAVLQMVYDALDRIQDRTYGICDHCSESIHPKRLDAVPWARYCVRCQDLLEKGLLKD